jgi:hypothetical protein
VWIVQLVLMLYLRREVLESNGITLVELIVSDRQHGWTFDITEYSKRLLGIERGKFECSVFCCTFPFPI